MCVVVSVFLYGMAVRARECLKTLSSALPVLMSQWAHNRSVWGDKDPESFRFFKPQQNPTPDRWHSHLHPHSARLYRLGDLKLEPNQHIDQP